MYVTTLIARPGQLDPAAAEALRNAWGGGALQWLAPDEAAEFPLETLPENRWQVWEDMLQVMEHLGMTVSAKQRQFFTK